MTKQIVLMDHADIQRVIRRMAVQIWEHVNNEDPPVIIGLNTKGYQMGALLSEHLKDRTGEEIEVHEFNVKDTPSNQQLPDCSDRHVILVDDVIFSGRTMFDAISTICRAYEPKRIQTLLLLDRGHRRYPIKADIVGRSTPTKVGEHIEVMLKDKELQKVILFKNQ